ncbi:unnamed protein product [Diplocarpon coronariae]
MSWVDDPKPAITFPRDGHGSRTGTLYLRARILEVPRSSQAPPVRKALQPRAPPPPTAGGRRAERSTGPARKACAPLCLALRSPDGGAREPPPGPSEDSRRRPNSATHRPGPDHCGRDAGAQDLPAGCGGEPPRGFLEDPPPPPGARGISFSGWTLHVHGGLQETEWFARPLGTTPTPMVPARLAHPIARADSRRFPFSRHDNATGDAPPPTTHMPLRIHLPRTIPSHRIRSSPRGPPGFHRLGKSGALCSSTIARPERVPRDEARLLESGITWGSRRLVPADDLAELRGPHGAGTRGSAGDSRPSLVGRVAMSGDEAGEVGVGAR